MFKSIVLPRFLKPEHKRTTMYRACAVIYGLQVLWRVVLCFSLSFVYHLLYCFSTQYASKLLDVYDSHFKYLCANRISSTNVLLSQLSYNVKRYFTGVLTAEMGPLYDLSFSATLHFHVVWGKLNRTRIQYTSLRMFT